MKNAESEFRWFKGLSISIIRVRAMVFNATFINNISIVNLTTIPDWK
jgi:hypothetical protein